MSERSRRLPEAAVGKQGNVVAVEERNAGEDRIALPSSGPISRFVGDLFRTSANHPEPVSSEAARVVRRLVEWVDQPLSDDDLQLALYLCFELHYRSFPGVDPAWEWDPGLLAMRAVLEQAFFEAWRPSSGPASRWTRHTSVTCCFASSPKTMESRSPGTSRSRRGIEEFREFVVHRSLYQLKEADPHSWAIPRLDRAGEGGAARGPGRRVRRRPGRAHALAALRQDDAGARAGRSRERLPRTGARHDAGDRQPDVRCSACAAAAAARSSGTWRCSR